MSERLMIRGQPPRSPTVALLEAEGLPASDLTDAHLEHFFFIGAADSPTALVGLEICGIEALLRSLVVSAGARNRGTGSALVLHAEEYAASRRVRAIYLLTATAESFFRRMGYRRVDRAEAPPAIQSTREFASLCPVNSAFMVKRLQQDR